MALAKIQQNQLQRSRTLRKPRKVSWVYMRFRNCYVAVLQAQTKTSCCAADRCKHKGVGVGGGHVNVPCTWVLYMLLRSRCPRGSVGRASFLTALTDCLGDSIPCWSVSKSQDRRPAERQRARAKKKMLLRPLVLLIRCVHEGVGWGSKSNDLLLYVKCWQWRHVNLHTRLEQKKFNDLV